MTAGLLLAAALLVAAPPASAAPAAPAPVAALEDAAGRDVVLIAAAETLGGSDRVAVLLQDMCTATDVLGPVRFEVHSAPGTWPVALAAPALRRDDLRALVVIVGDGALLPGIDPNAPPRPVTALARRELDAGRLRRELDTLVARVADHAPGLDLVLCTAPLGLQGHVEVPELLPARAMVREAGAALDLGAHFEDLERAPLFVDGVDTLDTFGHDELARTLWRALIAEDSPVPPRDDAERAARAEARAFQALHDGELAEFERLGWTLLEEDVSWPRSRVRRALIAQALDERPSEIHLWSHGSPQGTRGDDRWRAGRTLDGWRDVPGAVLGRRLAERGGDTWRSFDPIEEAVVEILWGATVEDDTDTAREHAWALVDEHPHRVEAWAALQVAFSQGDGTRDLRGGALGRLASFDRGAADIRLARKVFDAWPARVRWLPAVIAASHPFSGMTPTGPLLDTARRRAMLAGLPVAGEVLEERMEGGRFPPAWHAEAERLASLGPR